MGGSVSQKAGESWQLFSSSSLKFPKSVVVMIFITAVRAVEVGCMQRDGGVYVCRVGWGRGQGGEHLAFFSIALSTWN